MNLKKYFNLVLLAGLLFVLRPPQGWGADAKHKISQVEVIGADHTDVDWLKYYIDVEPFDELSDLDVEILKKKILTTQVFSSVQLSFKPDTKTPGFEVLVCEIEEKWTWLPIIRAAYGGGTPVTILGTYNIHTFGRLWTLGAEAQKYGDAPVGGVLWARAPRWLKGKHVLGGELWKDYRKRIIYKGLTEEDQLGMVSTDATMLRGLYLMPVNWLNFLNEGSEWQAGLDFKVRLEAPTTFESYETGPQARTEPPNLSLPTKKSIQHSLLPTFIYDNMFIDNLDHDGVRTTLKAGPAWEEQGASFRYETESFVYWLWNPHLELGTHLLVGGSTSDSLQSTYFLGGLDTIRGIPDGAIYGPRVANFNAELKKIWPKFKYLWFQNALFVDWGGAGRTWKDVYDSQKSSVGVGVRFAIPQIYRLLVRVDYAWSLDRPGVSSISFGTAQFFQPYKPL